MLRYHIPSEFNYETATLREKIKYHLRIRGMKQTELALAVGVGKSFISQLMNGNKKFSLEQLEKITEVLKLQRDIFYVDYINEECLNDNKIKKTKCEKFLVKCAEIGQGNLIDRTASILYENKTKNLCHIFNAAEGLFQSRKYDEAESLYATFTERTKNKLNIRLAISYYRLFYIARKAMLNNRTSVRVAREKLIILKDYLELLPLETKMDAYVEIAVFYNAMEDFDNAIRYAKKVLELFNNVGEEEIKKVKDPTRYRADALLFLAFGYRGLGEYDIAIKTFNIYSQVRESSKYMAEGNKLLVRILKGEFECIDEYLNWAKTDDHATSVVHIALESFINNKRLDKVKSFLINYETLVNIQFNKTDVLNLKYKLRVIQYIIEYLIATNQQNIAIDYLIHGMEIAAYLENKNRYNRCWHIFSNNSMYATSDQINSFNKIIVNNTF